MSTDYSLNTMQSIEQIASKEDSVPMDFEIHILLAQLLERAVMHGLSRFGNTVKR